jgi:hypothetical protein
MFYFKGGQQAAFLLFVAKLARPLILDPCCLLRLLLLPKL